MQLEQALREIREIRGHLVRSETFRGTRAVSVAATGIEAVVCCRDPDGLIVEFIEYAPGVLGSRIASLERRTG